MGFCRFRFLRFGQTFLPQLGHFGEEKNSPISPSKKFPAVFDAILPFSVAKTQQPTPIFSFYRGTPHKLSEKILEFC